MTDVYRDLSLEQALALREEIRERYWDAMDNLGAVALEKANINNHIQYLSELIITGDDGR